MAATTDGTRRSMARLRLALWVLVLLVAAGAVAAMALRHSGPDTLGLTGKPFTLAATDGTTFTEKSLVGTPTMLFFGYTFCPDVCPTTLAALAGWREQLKLSPDKLRIVFASVDPQRDTIPVLESYLSNFGTPILGLTGTPDQVAQAELAFGVYAKKIDDDGKGNYLMQHTAAVFLMDAAGHYQGQIDYGEDSKSALSAIREIAG